MRGIRRVRTAAARSCGRPPWRAVRHAALPPRLPRQRKSGAGAPTGARATARAPRAPRHAGVVHHRTRPSSARPRRHSVHRIAPGAAHWQQDPDRRTWAGRSRQARAAAAAPAHRAMPSRPAHSGYREHSARRNASAWSTCPFPRGRPPAARCRRNAPDAATDPRSPGVRRPGRTGRAHHPRRRDRDPARSAGTSRRFPCAPHHLSRIVH